MYFSHELKSFQSGLNLIIETNQGVQLLQIHICLQLFKQIL